MLFIERLSEFFGRLNPCKAGSQSGKNGALLNTNEEETPRVNPWTRDLERLSAYLPEEEKAPEAQTKGRSDSCENKIQLLMEQARLEKAKEALQKQQESLGLKQPEAAKPRRNDATVVDAKAWWGQSVATWNPEDGQNIGHQGEQRHPRTHKWFNN